MIRIPPWQRSAGMLGEVAIVMIMTRLFILVEAKHSMTYGWSFTRITFI